MITSPLLSIIVVSYNTCEMTLACLRSVFIENIEADFEIIVIDNASSDGSAEAIKNEFGSRVTLLVSRDNLGFAAGNNRAAVLARGKYLLLLNPDTIVLTGAINALVAFARARPDAGIWGGRTLFPDGSLNPASCWSRQTLWSLFCQGAGLTFFFRNTSMFNPEAMGGWDRSGIRDVDIVSGCFLLIRREIWNELGGFDEAYFMYGEEADLCLRARSHDVHPLVTSEATIIHYGGASEHVRADKLVRLLKAKAMLINRHFPPAERRLGLALLYLWPLSRSWAFKILSLLGSASRKDHDAWRQVVLRRVEWLS